MKRMSQILLWLVFLMASVRAGASEVETFVRSAAVDSAFSAVMVIDLATGRQLAEHNSAAPLIPASILKTVTIATLLDKTGIDRRFETEVYTDGRIKDGVLQGNIIVAGSGDPSLNSRQKPESPDICWEIWENLREKGVERIAGKIIVDESLWDGPAYPPSWAAADLPHSYGTGSHALNFEDNASGKRAVKDPAAAFRKRLQSFLSSRGIKVAGGSVGEGRRHKLLTHKSGTIDDIMRSCMMRSDNLFAESLLRTYAVERGEKGNTAKAADLEKKYWSRKDIPMEGVEIVDGSGLSRSNRVTAAFIAGVLTKMAENVDYASFFPLAGQEGTLKNFLRDTPLDSYVALKTGSMNGIQCYAGYKLDDDYAPTHVIVVIHNKLPKGRAAAREATARMLLNIFNPGSGAAVNAGAEEGMEDGSASVSDD